MTNLPNYAKQMWGEAEFEKTLMPKDYRSVEPQNSAEEQLAQAVNMLAAAKFPIILAGQGVHIARTIGVPILESPSNADRMDSISEVSLHSKLKCLKQMSFNKVTRMNQADTSLAK